VVSVSSFTKILAPGLRVGWIETARSIVDTISDRGYVNSGGCVAPFAASIVVSAIENGSQARWLQRLRERYRGTSRALHDAASREKASTGWKVASCPPSGGYFLWIELPADCDERGVTRAAEDAGVAFLPGSRCVPGGTLEVPREERSCRLCFAYLDEEKIVEGVKRLAESVRNARGK
jgi:DNA-binding transcriptional MocR family regulator